LSFYFSYAEGFRTPTVAEFPAFNPPLFTPTVTNLDPVKSRSFEIGARGKLGKWAEGSLAFFYMPVRDEILFVVTDPATFSGRNDNIKRSLRRGVELTLKSHYGKWIDAFLNYSFTKATFETDILLLSGQVNKGDEFPLVPRHRTGVGVNLYPVDGLTLSLFGNYAGRQYLLNDEPNRSKRLGESFTLNSRASYQWESFTATLEINNLTNEKYSSFGILGAQPFFMPAPGTNVFARINFHY
jgi:outer membrane receptor protein involved in Fe transport